MTTQRFRIRTVAGVGAALVALAAAVVVLIAGRGADPLPVADPSAGSVDTALTAYFSTDVGWRSQMFGDQWRDGTTLCGVDVLGRSDSGTSVYTWMECEVYTLVDGQAVLTSGVSVPILVTLSAATLPVRVVRWRVPTDGMGYAADVRAMFPSAPAERALNQDVRARPTAAQRLQAARQALSSARATASSQEGMS